MNFYKYFTSRLLDGNSSSSSTISADRLLGNIMILVGEKEFNESYEASLNSAYKLIGNHNNLKENSDRKVDFITIAGQEFHSSFRKMEVYRVHSKIFLKYYSLKENNDVNREEEYDEEKRSLGCTLDMMMYNGISNSHAFWELHEIICEEYYDSINV